MVSVQMKLSCYGSSASARQRLVSVLLVILLYPLLAGFDLAQHSVPPDQILNGGPPKNGIPAILQPKFIPAATAAGRGRNETAAENE